MKRQLFHGPASHFVVKSVQKGLGRLPSLKRFVRPGYLAAQRLRHHRLIAPNEALRGRYAGGRCFVMFTGPSIHEIDFSLLRDERVFGCAALYRHPRFRDLKIDF